MATELTLATVVGPVETPAGLKPTSGRVQWRLPAPDGEGSTVVGPVVQEALLDAEGQFSKQLWCPAEGAGGYSYAVSLTWWDDVTAGLRTVSLGYMTLVYSASPQPLKGLLVPEMPSVVPTDILALAAAYAAASEAEADAAAADRALAQAAAAAAALYAPAYFKDKPAFLLSATVWSVGTRINARTGEVWDVVSSGEDFTHPVSGIKVKNVIGPIRVFDDFSLELDGPLVRVPTGQNYLIWPATGPARPRIASGFMTFDPAATGGGYASVQTTEPIVHMGARFAFSPYTTTAGAVGIIPWANDIGASFDAALGVPATAGHFVISPTAWSLGTYPGGGGAESILAAQTFATPLLADGVTLHTAEIWLDYNNKTAIVALPNGEVLKYSNLEAAQGIEGYFACVEPYKALGVTGGFPKFESWWATAGDKDALEEGYRRLENYRTTIAAKEGVYAVPADITLNNTYQLIPALAVDCWFPKSGKILVDICCYVEVTTPGDIVLTIQNGVTVLTSVNGVGDTSGWKTIQRVITLPAFIDQKLPLSIGARAFSGAGKVKVDSDRYTPSISAVGLLA